MTVSTEISREEYTGNGVTTDFDYRFRVFSADELVVSVADTTENISTLVLNTDYTVTGAGSRTGGKVKLVNPLANAWRISIERDLPVTQETDVRNQGNFFPEVHEDAWDKLTMLIQQAIGNLGLALRKPNWLAKYYDAKGNRIANLGNPVNGQDATTKSYVDGVALSNLSRALRVPEPIPSLPPAASRRNTMPAFDSAGEPTVMVPVSGSAADVLLQLASDDKYLAPVDHVHLRNDVTVSFRKFLTVKDGSVDATAAVQAALDSGYAIEVPHDYIIRLDSPGFVASGRGRFFGAKGSMPTILINHTIPTVPQFSCEFGTNAVTGHNYFANLKFRYPLQKFSLLSGESPIEYGPLFAGSGFNSTFENLDIGNAFYGFKMGDENYSSSRITISNVIGAPLRRGISLDRVLDIPHVSDVHFNYNYFGGETGYVYDLTLKQWIHDNGIAFHIGRCDFGGFRKLFGFGYYNGLLLRTERFTGSANSVRFIDCDFDICVHPLRFQNWQNSVSVIGGKFTGNGNSTAGLVEKESSTNLMTNSPALSGNPIGVITLIGGEYNNYSSDAFQGTAKIEAIGTLIYQFGKDNAQRAAFTITAGSSQDITAIGCSIDGSGGTQTRAFSSNGTGTLRIGDGTVLSNHSLGSFDWRAGPVVASCSASLGGNPGHNGVSFITKIPKNYLAEVMPTSGSFYGVGDYVQKTNPVKTSFASQPNYVIKGWVRLTSGSSHVLDTDWVEDRTYFAGVS